MSIITQGTINSSYRVLCAGLAPILKQDPFKQVPGKATKILKQMEYYGRRLAEFGLVSLAP